MSETANIVSKILVIDDGDIEVLNQIKRFCNDNNLIGLKSHNDNVMNVLKSNVDVSLTVNVCAEPILYPVYDNCVVRVSVPSVVKSPST